MFVDLAGFGQTLQALAQRTAVFAFKSELPCQVADIDFTRGFEDLKQGLVVGQPVRLMGLFSFRMFHCP